MAQRRIRLPPLPPVFERDESHTLVDDFTLRAERHRARQAPATPPVFPLPLRTHPLWSGNNSLGFELPIVDVTETAVFERTVLKLDEWGEPKTWTIILSTNFVAQNANQAEAFFLQGLLEIGAGGAVDQINVDWRNGTVLRLPMNALNVKILGVVGDPAGGPGSTIPSNLAVRVLLSRANHSGLPPQFTAINVSTSGGAVDPSDRAANIPKYAKAFRPLARSHVVADNMFANNFYWDFYGTSGFGGSIIGSLRADQSADYLGGFGGIPIPNGARFVVFNDNAAPIGGDPRLDLVFDLSL